MKIIFMAAVFCMLLSCSTKPKPIELHTYFLSINVKKPDIINHSFVVPEAYAIKAADNEDAYSIALKAFYIKKRYLEKLSGKMGSAKSFDVIDMEGRNMNTEIGLHIRDSLLRKTEKVYRYLKG